MNLLPFLLLTPLVWLVISTLLFASGGEPEAAAVLGAIYTLALWGVLLLLTK